MNKVKGTNYEFQIRDYIINSLNKKAYLWSDTPESILINNGLIGSHNENRIIRKENKENPLQDTGIDIIQIESSSDSISLVQCKNGYKNGITMSDLAGFALWMVSMENLKGYVYYTDKLSGPIKAFPKTDRVQYIKHPYIDNTITIKNKTKIEAYQYQLDAKTAIENHFKKEDRAILSLPCGTGKTFTSYLISQNYKQIIIISPLKQFAKQNMERFIEYGFGGKTLLVDSDGERNIDEVKKFIKENNNFLISSTYCSIDIIEQCLKLTKDSLIIIDEFHNLSKTNMFDDNDNFNKILFSDQRILFMSATPRVYELEYEDVECDIESIFGKVVYNMTFTEAIKNKYITDYRIYLPSIHEDNSELNKELSIYKIDSVIKSKCNFLFSCLLNNGSKKTIIYCIDTNEINEMIIAMKSINDFYTLELEYQQITAENSEKQRTEILNKFAESNNRQLLFSIRILDECIDIPSCDSIYITYPSQSKVRTIQRMCRCIRIDKNNPFKIGNVYIWCNEYDKIIDTLSGIKEYDIFFKDKITINETNFFGDSNVEGIEKDDKLIEKYIIGVKEYKIMNWNDKLKWVKNYIDENDKRPSKHNENIEIKKNADWLGHQLLKFKNNTEIMKNEIIRKEFSEFINGSKYKKYFISNEQEWLDNLEWVKNYMDKNNKRPSKKDDKNEEIKIHGGWLANQLIKFKAETEIMKNEKIRKIFEEFINDPKYKKHFSSNNDQWLSNLEWINKYIIDNKKRPSSSDKDETTRFYGLWINTQMRNYQHKTQIMSDENIRKQWESFVEVNKDLFLTDQEQWIKNHNWVKNYIDSNNKRPTKQNTDETIRYYGKWLGHQVTAYNNSEHLMKIPEINTIFKDFINDSKYKNYFI